MHGEIENLPTLLVLRDDQAPFLGPLPPQPAVLELNSEDSTPSGDNAVIEAQLPASQYRELGLTEGELLVLTPRKARVFVEGTPDLVSAV